MAGLFHKFGTAACLFRNGTFWRRFSALVFDCRHRMTYSQTGEDALLRAFLAARLGDARYQGFYVDIGAHDPTRFSNTKMFWQKGWRGINVDAMESAIRKFRKARPGDVNVWTGIGGASGELAFYEFDEPTLNTFSETERDEVLSRGAFHLVATSKVPVTTLKDLLDTHLPEGRRIDFLTIDVEGMELEILRSNDWERYRPDYILVEVHAGASIERVSGSEIARFLQAHGYVHAGQTLFTSLFRHSDVAVEGVWA